MANACCGRGSQSSILTVPQIGRVEKSRGTIARPSAGYVCSATGPEDLQPPLHSSNSPSRAHPGRLAVRRKASCASAHSRPDCRTVGALAGPRFGSRWARAQQIAARRLYLVPRCRSVEPVRGHTGLIYSVIGEEGIERDALDY